MRTTVEYAGRGHPENGLRAAAATCRATATLACIFGWFNRLMRIHSMHANVAMAGVAVSLLPSSPTRSKCRCLVNESGRGMAAGGGTAAAALAAAALQAPGDQPM